MDDQTFLNQLAEKLSKLGTVRPLGFHYLHPYGNVPADSIICNGATYSRSLYKDFFDYVVAQGWVKTESEWQEIANRDNGFCPFYSTGDGSTNFRTPKFAPYQQIAMGVAQATTYHQAGIPNIKGVASAGRTEKLPNSGAYSSEQLNTLKMHYSSSGKIAFAETFDASLYDPTYGRSTTVTPESHSWVMCVVAYGVATNVGSVDIQNVMSAVNQVQAKMPKLDAISAYVTETWKSTDGNSWYRKYSDGFIQQGGTVIRTGTALIENFVVNFPTPYTKDNVSVVCSLADNSNITRYISEMSPHNVNKTSFSYRQSLSYPFYWIASGY